MFPRKMLELTEEYVIVSQNNGYGDQINASTMIRCIQEEAKRQGNPDIKIILKPAMHETWENNPRIHTLFKGEKIFEYNFFERWKKDKKYPVIDPSVYAYIETMDFNNNDYVDPFAKILCDLNGIPFDEDNAELYFTDDEINVAQRVAESFKKPIILIHTPGSNLQNQNLADPHTFNLNKDWVFEHWVNLTNLLYNDFDVVQVGMPNEQLINGALDLRGKISFRHLLALTLFCVTWVDIDSFLQHAGAAVKKPGVVLWGRTDPRVFGHTINTNMQASNSCPDIPCMRPRAAGGDIIIVNGEMVPWACSHMNCMKNLSAEKVAGQVFEIANREKQPEKQVLEPEIMSEKLHI